MIKFIIESKSDIYFQLEMIVLIERARTHTGDYCPFLYDLVRGNPLTPTVTNRCDSKKPKTKKSQAHASREPNQRNQNPTH